MNWYFWHWSSHTWLILIYFELWAQTMSLGRLRRGK